MLNVSLLVSKLVHKCIGQLSDSNHSFSYPEKHFQLNGSIQLPLVIFQGFLYNCDNKIFLQFFVVCVLLWF